MPGVDLGFLEAYYRTGLNANRVDLPEKGWPFTELEEQKTCNMTGALVKGIIRDIVSDLVWFLKTGACRYLHLFS